MKSDGRSFDDMLKAGRSIDGIEDASSPSSSSTQTAGQECKADKLPQSSWTMQLGQRLARIVGTDLLFWIIRSCVDARLRVQKCASKSTSNAAAHDTGDLTSLLKLLLDIHAFQLFNCSFFNGDPHPGNILLLPDGRIGLIDFGQCRSLSDEQRKRFAELFTALTEAPSHLGASAEADDRIAAAFTSMGVRSRDSQKGFLAMMPRLMFSRFEPEWFKR